MIYYFRRPLNSTPLGSTVQILVHQRYSWRRDIYFCNDTTIANGGLLESNSNIRCYTGKCATSGWPNKTTNVHCTDFSVAGDLSTGERYDIVKLPLYIYIDQCWFYIRWLAIKSCCWCQYLLVYHQSN